MIADMPDLKTAMKRPVSILNRMITRVERRLNEERTVQQGVKEGFHRNGNHRRGEDRMAGKLTGLLKEKGVRVGGILALRIVEEGTNNRL